jgi:hypothetical protein
MAVISFFFHSFHFTLASLRLRRRRHADISAPLLSPLTRHFAAIEAASFLHLSPFSPVFLFILRHFASCFLSAAPLFATFSSRFAVSPSFQIDYATIIFAFDVVYACRFHFSATLHGAMSRDAIIAACARCRAG